MNPLAHVKGSMGVTERDYVIRDYVIKDSIRNSFSIICLSADRPDLKEE